MLGVRFYKCNKLIGTLEIIRLGQGIRTRTTLSYYMFCIMGKLILKKEVDEFDTKVTSNIPPLQIYL